VESNVGQGCVGSVEQLSNLAFGGSVVDDKFNSLVAREITDNLGIDPRDRFKPSRPVAVIVRPGEPGGSVGFPLGGHVKVEGCRGNT
jgi:hypothetical protein